VRKVRKCYWSFLFYQVKKTFITTRRPSFLSRSPLCPSHYLPGRSPLKEKWWHVFHSNNCMLSIFSHFTLINANERVCRRLCLLLRSQHYIQLRSNEMFVHRERSYFDLTKKQYLITWLLRFAPWKGGIKVQLNRCISCNIIRNLEATHESESLRSIRFSWIAFQTEKKDSRKSLQKNFRNKLI